MAINLPRFKLPALEANPIHSRPAIILFPYFCAFSLLFRGRKTFARVATRQQQKLRTVGWKFNVCFVFLIVTRGGIAALSLRSHSNDRKPRHKSLSLGTCFSLFEELVFVPRDGETTEEMRISNWINSKTVDRLIRPNFHVYFRNDPASIVFIIS